MRLPGSVIERKMTNKLRGAFGSFTTTGALQMSFLTTRLGIDELKYLKTARQVLPRNILTIKELMQRDIDDKRVQQQIVNYLTPKSGQFNPVFFPPLVVAILVKSNDIQSSLLDLYPPLELINNKPPRKLDNNEDVWYEERFYGNAFGIRIPLNQEETDVNASDFFHSSELSWDRDMVDMLVIDGQHRLIALKAALGVLEAEEMVRGYEGSRLSPEKTAELGFNSIPVSFIFPPQLYQNNEEIPEQRTLVSVFRQVFVDVNKNAKPVSESRNILLNERDLVAVFTRNVIDTFVTEKKLPKVEPIDATHLPLYTFEWDSPEKKEYQFNDTRAVSTVGILYQIIEELLYTNQKDEIFRTEMGVEEGDPKLDPNINNTEGPNISDVNPENFASWQRLELEKRFNSKWINALIYVFRNIYTSQKLVNNLENKRISLLQEISEQQMNPTPKLSLDYLVGTKDDQKQIETVAKYEHQVGHFNPIVCSAVIQNIKKDFLERQIEEEIREGNFSRLFFSNLGQNQLFKFIFKSVHINISTTTQNTVLKTAEAFVSDFNSIFEHNQGTEKLFDPLMEWNEPIQRLGTQQFKVNNVSGLLKISLAFFPDEGNLSKLFNTLEDWNVFRNRMFEQGLDEISEALKSYLPNTLKYDASLTIITDSEKRRVERDKLTDQRSNEYLMKLSDFVKKHSNSKASFSYLR
jgi:hypothetical protein